MIGFIKELVKTNAARLIAYSGAVAVAAALKGAELVGIKLTAEVLVGISGLAVIIATELIRRFVYSIDTTQKVTDRAAATGNTDIGEPPSGEVPTKNPEYPDPKFDG